MFNKLLETRPNRIQTSTHGIFSFHLYKQFRLFTNCNRKQRSWKPLGSPRGLINEIAIAAVSCSLLNLFHPKAIPSVRCTLKSLSCQVQRTFPSDRNRASPSCVHQVRFWDFPATRNERRTWSWWKPSNKKSFRQQTSEESKVFKMSSTECRVENSGKHHENLSPTHKFDF